MTPSHQPIFRGLRENEDEAPRSPGTLIEMPLAAYRARVDETPEVRDLVEKLIAAVAARADAAALVVINGVQAELQAERDTLAHVREELAVERANRQSLEASFRDAANARDRLAAEYETKLREIEAGREADRSEMLRLQTRLDAAKNEAAALLNAVQAVQRAVSSAQSPEPEASRPVQEKASPATEPAVEVRPQAAERSLQETLLPTVDALGATTEFAPEDSKYAKELLEEIESMYQMDRVTAASPSEVSERLTANLRHARELLIRRVGSREGEILFKQQLNALLEANWNTDFGRHLGFSSYDLYPPSERSISAA